VPAAPKLRRRRASERSDMIPERYAPMTYAMFRIVFGFIFLCFGLQKVLGWFGQIATGHQFHNQIKRHTSGVKINV
jgi:uncharacterized membrane protein YphA (DoxX/SURF4 family)